MSGVNKPIMGQSVDFRFEVGDGGVTLGETSSRAFSFGETLGETSSCAFSFGERSPSNDLTFTPQMNLGASTRV
jgi:hypothetical protein